MHLASVAADISHRTFVGKPKRTALEDEAQAQLVATLLTEGVVCLTYYSTGA